ncbi:PLP-dependent aminotransferase family protein [Pendulispora rubella]|uniref:PLP-dependent aminotransferase family protein n=1 Tax=Pendulispora rubella TaxID=2741070 RepID=A0ABZ2KU45_9BACT
MTTLHLPIDRASRIPIYRQIYDGLRQAILDGVLHPGQKVPSTRALAEELEVSRLPVLTAYEQLLHECYLEGRLGSGTFVSAALPDHLLRSPAPAHRRGRIRPPPAARDYGGLGPFRTSLPALDQFPQAVWARLVARHAHTMTRAQMAYGDPAGVAALRDAIAEHLRAARGVRCEAEQVLVVSGSQAALRVTAAVLLARGDGVAMEEPGYPGARAALTAGGARAIPVAVDEEGLRVSTLRTRGAMRAVYVTPSHQYPLGMSMTAARRLELLDWASRQNAWILEDDYDSDYRYVSRPLGALQGMDTQARVIYIGSFSKVLFPALRIGYVVVPPSLVPRFADARASLDLFSPTLYQLALAEFLREGHFARHVRRMRGVYMKRREALLTGLARHCAEWLSVYNADAGLHVTVLLARGINDDNLVARMAARRLTATALSACYAGRARQQGLLLGFGGSTERRLLEATRILSEISTPWR